MQCPACRHENPPQAKFCLECGARMVLSCPKCRVELPTSAKFCLECGTPVTGRASAEPRFSAPDAYTPKHLADRILTSRAALEGERKQVTVLFADLKGSMELLADRDPEDARRILDPVLELMMDAVHRYEGTVNQVMGDGIMALFGAPIAHEDHAVRGCYAALAMQASVKKYAEDMRRRHGITVSIRVGLNSGEVVVGAVGSDLRMDYTAVGQTTHLAARMEQLADPGSVLLTPATLALAEGYVDVRSLGPTPVKGLVDPVEVYVMHGASAIRSRFQAAAARGLTKFVGRTAEMEQLSQALEHARDGRGQLVAVVGEPGVGKSRLYYEFTRSHRVHDCLVIESNSVSYGKATAYLPVIDLLRTYFRIEGRDDARIIREKVTGRLLSLDRALEPFLPALLWLLEVPVSDPSWDRLDPPQRRQQTLDGVRRLLLRESHLQPVVVVFEDLHWIDAETQALVDALVESLPTARIVMLVNYRPEYQHAWGSKTYYRQLRIDALPVASAHELLDAMLGTDPSVQPLKALLVRRTEGTPFFLEESVRTLVETRVLAGARGGYRLTKPVDTIEVPATVKALLAARIDRLTPDEKAVLQAASVIGTDVPLALLQAIAEIPDEALRRRLGDLQAAEFLYETNLFPEVEYTFKHALTHEVAYGSLLGERRRTLHARIAAAIERIYAARLSEQVERLAHHTVRGEVWDQAVRYLHEAGTKAFRRSASVEAVAYLTQGLDAVGKLPSSRETTRQELGLLLALGPALHATQGFGGVDVGRTYARARQLGEEFGEPSEMFQALWGLWLHTVGGRGRFESGRPMAENLLSLAERLDDRALRLEARHAMLPSTLWMGEPRAAREHGEQGMVLYDRDQHHALTFLYGGHDAGVCCRMHSGLALWILGYPVAALERCRAGLALARDLAHPGSIVNALPFLGLVYQLRGDVTAMRAVSESTVALAGEHGFSQWLAFGKILDGWAEANQRRDDAAMMRLRLAIDDYRTIHEIYVPFFLALLAATYLKHGQLAAGLETLDGAQRMADASGAHAWDADFLRLRGELVLAARPADEAEAEAAFRQAIDVARRQDAKSWELRAVTSLGRLLGRRGQRDEARRMLAEVYGWFTEGFDTADLRDAKAVLDELSGASG
ncbi:MAG: AAA family ATPase [Candidatus Rokubacteria bacterium]|nr:AAA family ATPase [Candidatus Rokubacteria bacterium]